MQKRDGLRPEAKEFRPDSTHIDNMGPATESLLSSKNDAGREEAGGPQQNNTHDVRQVSSFTLEASHYDNGLTRPTEQRWKGFQTAERARQAITNLITWPPYCFRRIILQDLSNPEEPQYSLFRDGPVKGGRKDAVFTLQKIVVDELDS